ncbi:MAG: response regulator [Segetibacter sp.]
MHILMADDDKDDFHILQQTAQDTGEPLKISYAANWLELWRFIIKTLPDVLFLDLNMPVKNGMECLQLLREDRRYDKVPIIIYSTSVNKNDIDKAYSNGANYFAVKPNAIEDIAGMINKICSMGKEALQSIPPREEFVII